MAVSPNGQQFLPDTFNLTAKAVPQITSLQPAVIYQQDRAVTLNISALNTDSDTLLQIVTPLGVVIYEAQADSIVTIPANTFQLDVNIIRLHVKASDILSNEAHVQVLTPVNFRGVHPSQGYLGIDNTFFILLDNYYEGLELTCEFLASD